MPVDTKHKSYEKYEKKWEKYRKVIEGEDAVKEAGKDFLPMLGGQENMSIDNESSYKSYKERASFFEATGRTLEGIIGVVFRKEPKITFPESKKDYLKEISKEGLPLTVFAKKVFTEVVSINRAGVMLDIDENAEANAIPFFALYKAEDILNWRCETINGKKGTTLVVLKEDSEEEDPSDPYKLNTVNRLRVLKLGNIENDGNKKYYYVETHKKAKDEKSGKDKYILEKIIIPTRRGKKLEYIPFVFFNSDDLTDEVKKSKLSGIISINISHYRTSADLEHGRHFTGLPTAWVAGFKTDTKLYIGSTTAWVSEDPNANAGYLEFTGQGLGTLEKALEQKEGQMAVLGARLLEAPKSAVESADTHAIRRSGESSVTASTAGTVGEGIEMLLTWALEWAGITGEEVEFELNKDYTILEMSPQMLTALMSAVQSGEISKDTFIYNLQRGELLPDGRTLEEELDLIAQQTPNSNTGLGMNLDEETSDKIKDKVKDKNTLEGEDAGEGE